ncbi:MAG: DUF4810 domain-containing protein [Bacteroidales bacterium]|jgi:hypothetical protein|nr:DUF4810 domain-containing protein [Bacteroidales bacterium]
MLRYLSIILIVILFSGCSNALYEYYDYDNLTYFSLTQTLNEKDVKRISRKFQNIVKSPKGKRKMPPPGACFEYAFLLAKQDKKEEAKEYFLKEITLYPESEQYVKKTMQSFGL